MNLPMRNGQISRNRSNEVHGTFTAATGGGDPAWMYASSPGVTLGDFSGESKPLFQKNRKTRPSRPMTTKAHCQPYSRASHTVSGDAITPTQVPELNRPV